MIFETVVATVRDDQLSTMLPLIHRNGLGNVARAIRAERGNPREQLRRAGVPIEQSPDHLIDAPRVLFIAAGARSQRTADLLLQQGAIHVWIVESDGYWRAIDDQATLITPDRDLAPIAAQPEMPLREEPIAPATPLAHDLVTEVVPSGTHAE